MTHRKLFDPANPHDVMADGYRKSIAHTAYMAQNVPVNLELSPEKQVSAFLVGTLTGLIGTLMAMTEEDSHDTIIEILIESIPECRIQAQSIMDSEKATEN